VPKTAITIVIILFSITHPLEVMSISNHNKISIIMINKTMTSPSLTQVETTWEVESVFHNLRRNSQGNKIR